MSSYYKCLTVFHRKNGKMYTYGDVISSNEYIFLDAMERINFVEVDEEPPSYNNYNPAPDIFNTIYESITDSSSASTDYSSSTGYDSNSSSDSSSSSTDFGGGDFGGGGASSDW